MSIFFDESYYLTQNPDVLQAIVSGAFTSPIEGVSAARYHFDTYGWKEMRDPSASFDTSFYLQNNLDVLAAGVNPYEHFINNGAAEGRVPNQTLETALGNPAAGAGDDAFDAAAYLAANTDVKAAVDAGSITAYQHWVLYGQFEGRSGAQTVGGQSLADVSGNVGSSFTLTEGPDSITGTNRDDTFVSSEATLSSADVLDGGDGMDTLRYASSGNPAVNESGFEASSVETVQVTSDAQGGTAFDVTGVSDLQTLRNFNSSENLSLTGIVSLVDVELSQIGSAGVVANNPTPNTVLVFDAAVVAGADDALNVSLDSNLNVDGTAVGSLVANGIETFNLTTTGGASQIGTLVSNSMETVNVEGDQDLTITGNLVGVTTVDANAFTGNLSVVVDSGAQDVAVTGGSGDDRADFSNGWDADDSFDGGEGTDTLGLSYGVATAIVPGNSGTATNVEILDVTTVANANGTIDMDNFASVEKVILNAGINAGNTVTVDDAVTGLEVELDVDAVATGNLVVDLKTDGADDELTIVLDNIGAGDVVNGISAADAETLNISANDTTNNGTGAVTVNTLTATDATTLNLSGDADITIVNTADPATPALATINASEATGDVTISGTNTAASGATIILGSGDDTFNVATSNGADSFTLGAGKDTLVYNAVAQSSGLNSDTVTDFTRGEDVIDVRALGTITASLFLGNAANTTAAETALTNTAGEAIFIQSDNVLVVDVNGDGDIGAGDLRVTLDGITELDAADLGLGTGVTFTANAASFNTANAADSQENNAVTNEDDTINATVAQLAGSIIDGLLGTDTLNVEGTAAAGEIADLTGTFDNVETVNIDSSVEGVSVNGSDLAAGGGDIATINGAAGTIQSLTVNANSDLSDTTISNIETLNLSGSPVTMTVAQHNGFGAINAAGGGDQITLDDAGTVTGDADIETYVLANGNNNFTVGTPGQNVTENGGVNTVQIGGQTIAGNYIGFDGDDTLVATNNAVLNGAQGNGAGAGSALGFGTLVMSGAVSMTAAQHNGFAAIDAAGGADLINLAGDVGVDVTGDADVESYAITSAAGAYNFTVGALDQNITETGTNATIVLDTAGAYTGTYFSIERLSLTADTDITGAGGITGSLTNVNIADNTQQTMTAAQYNVIEALADNDAGVVTGMAGTETITVTTSGAIDAMIDGGTGAYIENYVLNGAGADTITVSETSDAHLADAVRADMSIDLAGGGNDTIVIDNAAVDDAVDSAIDITNFGAGDTLVLSVGGASSSNGVFVNDYDASAPLAVGIGSIIEIDATAFQFGTASNTAAVLSFLTGAGITGAAGSEVATVVAYNGAGKAALYQIDETDGAAGAFDTIELIGVIDAADNSFTGANFA